MASKAFKDLTSAEEIKVYLDNAFRYTRDYVYHYTSLENVLNIFYSKELWFSSFDKTNDRIEKNFVTNLVSQKYFFSLMRTKIENFGMWAMYGGLTKKPEDPLESIYVKIEFPVSLLKEFIKQNNLSASLVAYTWQCKKPKDGKTVIFYGNHTNNKGITIDKKILSGYIKDTAWKYEQELRIWSDKKEVPVDEKFLKQLKIFPSPLYSIKACKEALVKDPRYTDIEKILSKALTKNDYEDTYISQ